MCVCINSFLTFELSLYNWIIRLRVLDCYTDPLGWKDQLAKCGGISNSSTSTAVSSSLCKDVKNLDKLFTLLLELGRGIVIAQLSSMVTDIGYYMFTVVL